MARQINISPRASQDIDDQFNHIAQDDFDAALQFFDAVRQTIAQLARMPGMGSLYPLSNARLAGLRRWPVKRFSKHLIFYLTDDNQLQILRVLHASRDIPSILDDGV